MKKEVKPTSKLPISLIPQEAVFETAKAFQFGATKHGKYGFRDGVEYSKLIDAGLRHLLQFADGEDIDEESQCIHAANVIANMAMLIWMYKNRPDMDDRFKKVAVNTKEFPKEYENVTAQPLKLTKEQMDALRSEFAPRVPFDYQPIKWPQFNEIAPKKCVRCEKGDSHICDNPKTYYKDEVMAGSKK